MFRFLKENNKSLESILSEDDIRDTRRSSIIVDENNNKAENLNIFIL